VRSSKFALPDINIDPPQQHFLQGEYFKYEILDAYNMPYPLMQFPHLNMIGCLKKPTKLG
jgi:hypothetical protein